ncbi:unnamed protein product [Orchesella dallaii]|uniref:CUB domain-containing protein n=1 Tax=Orchesella dallaii TaxID=48710 RepID=A0ABP1S5B0_9HEXA
MSNYHLARMVNSRLWSVLLATSFLLAISQVHGQMSTDPHLCGGYQRDMRGYIDFAFDDNTAPPGIASGKKFCMWTISPTVPSEQFRYNLTIRNVNLDCDAGDKITINYFNETDTNFTITEQFCQESHEVWQRQNQYGTIMVVTLYVEEIKMGNGFYMEWEEGYESRIPGPGRIRNTYYSFGRPSVDPNPYFAAGFFRKQISTFGFIKANYTQGYTMEMEFTEIQNCEGQADWQHCFNNTISVFNVGPNGGLQHAESFWNHNTSSWGPFSNQNGLFIMVQIVDEEWAGGKFTMVYDTVRG